MPQEAKKAIVTIVSGEKYENIWKRTEPFFIGYAEKCDAELIVLQGTHAQVPSPHWIKFSVYELLKKEFDRIAFIDADIIIRDDSPNIFDIVPEDQFGIFNEGQFTPRGICIYEVMKVYHVQDFAYDGTTYYNTGVFVCSKQHRHIFKINEEVKPLRNAFGEQTFLNMKIMLSGVKVFPLSFQFNRMSIMDRILGVSRLDAYFIHYAGDGENLIPKMDRDIKCWERDKGNYKYKKNIFIWALGGIGDLISAEPTIRFIREKFYSDAEIYLMSKEYEVYDHIKNINLSKGYPQIELDAVLEMNTHQLPWEAFGKYCAFQFTHCVDWVSHCVLGRQLSDAEKQIKLSYSDDDLKNVLKIYNKPEELVLVHPGVGWASKTFPVEYWNEIIKSLLGEGYKVGIIGKNVNEQHKVLDVSVEGCVDYRDKLSLKELFALISKAKVLVSNDSAPIHIAGAFDNYIILIPTCKHPDHIMPYRNGSKYYKAKALCKKLMLDDSYQPKNAGEVYVAKDIPSGHTIDEYLPEVGEVIETIKQFYDQCKKHCSVKTKGVKNDISLESYAGEFELPVWGAELHNRSRKAKKGVVPRRKPRAK
jgi:ADP-heptose:LPS heptosyltransferase